MRGTRALHTKNPQHECGFLSNTFVFFLVTYNQRAADAVEL
jgi:hypothetical protein